MIRAFSILLLAAALSLGVPIRRQEIIPNGFILETTMTGTIQATVINVGGNNYQVTVLKNGVQTGQQTFSNTQVPQIEAFVNTQLGGLTKIDGIGGVATVGTMQFFFKVVTFNPFVIKILCADIGVTVPANWYELQ